MGAKKKKTAGKVARNPLADPVLKARYEDELKRFRQAQSGEMTGWDEMYEALDAILYSDPPLYLAGSYKSARAFLAEHLPGMKEETARHNIRVARVFDPEDEKKHGVSKLALLLDYLEATGTSLEPGIKINPDRSKVRVPRGKTTRTELFRDVSYDELRAAARAVKGSQAASRSSDPPAVKAIRAALRKGHFGSVGVRLQGGKIAFSSVALGDVASFGRALAKIRLP
jgi:hypothetical protein